MTKIAQGVTVREATEEELQAGRMHHAALQSACQEQQARGNAVVQYWIAIDYYTAIYRGERYKIERYCDHVRNAGKFECAGREFETFPIEYVREHFKRLGSDGKEAEEG